MNLAANNDRFDVPTHLDIRLTENPVTAEVIADMAHHMAADDFRAVPITGSELALLTVVVDCIKDRFSIEASMIANRSFRYAKMVDSMLHDSQMGQLCEPTITSLNKPVDYAADLVREQSEFFVDHLALATQVGEDMAAINHPTNVQFAGQCAMIGLAAAERQHNQLVMSRILATVE